MTAEAQENRIEDTNSVPNTVRGFKGSIVTFSKVAVKTTEYRRKFQQLLNRDQTKLIEN